MHDPNQEFLDPTPRETTIVGGPQADLRPWLLIVTVAGVGGLIAGQAELAALAALAGLFAVAHAADLDPRRDPAYRALAWIVPVSSAALFLSLAWTLYHAEAAERTRTLGMIAALLGAAASLASISHGFAAELARSLFGVRESSRATRLAARLAILATLLSLPAGIAFPVVADELTRGGVSLVGGAASLWGNLAGMVLLAAGGVGFLVRRDARATAARLGLTRFEPRHVGVVLIGVVGMIAINTAAEWVQRTWFPGLWASDQKVNQLIAGSLTRPETLLLGLSAGFGEEIALRGALQPRLGIFRTSVLFALLHVQYSWFGMAIIALLGLGLGWIRRRSSTTAAIVVHGLYDVAAVLTLRG